MKFNLGFAFGDLLALMNKLLKILIFLFFFLIFNKCILVFSSDFEILKKKNSANVTKDKKKINCEVQYSWNSYIYSGNYKKLIKNSSEEFIYFNENIKDEYFDLEVEFKSKGVYYTSLNNLHCLIHIERNKMGNPFILIPNILITGLTFGLIPLQERYNDKIEVKLINLLDKKETIYTTELNFNSYFSAFFFLGYWFDLNEKILKDYESIILTNLIDYYSNSLSEKIIKDRIRN
jgi:hypothetical protein